MRVAGARCEKARSARATSRKASSRERPARSAKGAAPVAGDEGDTGFSAGGSVQLSFDTEPTLDQMRDACLAVLLDRYGGNRHKVASVLGISERNTYRLVKKLEACEHFDDLAHILFDQALLAEGGQLDDPAAYVRRINSLLVTAAV